MNQMWELVHANPRRMDVRLGLPKSTGALPGIARALDAPVLVSAGSLWNKKAERFREPGQALGEMDAALDSAGFVVMHQWGGVYPWTVGQYAELAASRDWTFWSQMDLCCEPEIADDPEEVQRRVEATAELYTMCREAGEELGISCPMPVLQGWTPADYVYSVELLEERIGDDWPLFVGVGSVCRRHLRGPDGLYAVAEALDEVLPPRVGVHWFGVKGSALPELGEIMPRRPMSTDSQAWGIAARRKAAAEGRPCRIFSKGREMAKWYKKQLDILACCQKVENLFVDVQSGEIICADCGELHDPGLLEEL